MSRITWFYIYGVLLTAVGLVVSAHVGQPFLAPDPLTFLAFTALAIIGQFLEVKYGRDSYYPHLVPFFSALLLLPPLAFVLVVLVPHLVEWVKRRLEGDPYPWYIQPFNIATHVIAGLIAQWIFFRLGGSLTEFSLQSTLIATIPSLLAYALINHILIGQILVLARGIAWSESKVLAFAPLATDTAMMSLGYVAALLWMLTPWLLLLVLAPLVLFYQALKVPELEKQNQMDPKTGLWNARYFTERLEEELVQALGLHRPLAIIMADLDLLRNINNAYGHLAGDTVIAGIGDIILQSIRKEDIACRFGGEEFAILLPNVDMMTAAGIAERIRQTVESTPFHVTTSVTPIRATMSLGIACFPQDGRSGTELIHEADVAQYQAKIQGRNRVVNSRNIPHAGRLLFDEAQIKKEENEAFANTFYSLAAHAEMPTAPVNRGGPAAVIAPADSMLKPSWWRKRFRGLAQHFLVMVVLGFFLAVAYMQMGALGIVVFSLPVIITHLIQNQSVVRTENSVRELHRMNQELSQANHAIAHANETIEQLNEELFLSLGKIIDARDPYGSGHATQVGKYAQAIAEELGLSAQMTKAIYQAGLLHDIGKIGIPEKILHKPTPLTASEYDTMKCHAALGADFLAACHDLKHLAPFVRHHHERWDGMGYPNQLQGEKIPFESRILAVCDAVEAMASDRSYQAGIPIDRIVQEIKHCSGTQFDPVVVDAFIRVIQQQPKLVLNSAITVSQNQFARQALPPQQRPILEQWHSGWAYREGLL